MKKLLLKTILVAAAILGVGMNAWGGKVGVVTTNVKVNFTGSITAANPCTYTKGAEEICGTTTGWFWKSSSSPSSDNGVNGDGHFTASNGNISIMMDSPSVGAKDIVNVSLDIAFGGHTGNDAAQYIKLLTTGENLVEESYTNYGTVSSTMGLTTSDMSTLNMTGSWRNTAWSERVHFNFIVNYATRKINLVVKNISGTTVIEKEIDMPVNAGYITGVNIGSSNQAASSRGVIFDNVYITTTEGDYGDIVSLTNSYTVNNTDKYQLFTEIQCPDITMELFGNGERTVTDYYFKYSDVEGWTSYEMTGGDSETYSCTVTKYLAAAPTPADIYGADDPNDGEIAKVTVTVSDTWNTSTQNSKKLLSGQFGTMQSSYQPLGGSIYKFTPTENGYLVLNFYKYNNINYRVWKTGSSYYASYKSANNEDKTWTLWLSKGSTYYFFSENTVAYQLKVYSFEFVPTVNIELGPNGYTTFSSAYPLALGSMEASEGEVIAYYVTSVQPDKAILGRISENVEAGEGLILRGTPNATITIPVAASGDAITNYLVGCPTATELTTPNSNYYVLVNNDENVEFQPLSGTYTNDKVTIPAGKAYLNYAGAGARLGIVFDDLTTSVSEQLTVNSEKFATAPVYNLQGQRVAQPAKGLYIVNGKKVLVK